MIEVTGDTTQDISNIIDELNRLNTNPLTNILQIVSYGTIAFTVPDTPATTTVASFPHGLDYAPVFLLKILTGSDFSVDLPFAAEHYFYSSGPQSIGGYPFNRFMSYADDNNIYAEVDNIGNPSGFAVSGRFVFTYYIFNRPINSGT